jgi:hypothetical protein
MIDLAKSKLFTPWTNPDTGVTLYLLTHKVAPLQQSLYYVNDGMSKDGRYLWFYCAFPPSAMRTLGVIDFERQEVRHFPETQFTGASPFVDPDSGAVYWCIRESIWCRGPEPDDTARCVNSLPEEIVQNRAVYRLATHLSRSANGREFFVDAALSLQWIFGTLPLDGGDFQMWHRFDRNHNHAQFSPTDPDLVLFAQENHPDPITGLKFGIEDRMWLIRRGEQPRPVLDTPTRVTHEWWDLDGEHVWCVWDNDAWRVNIDTQQIEKVQWPNHCWHAQDSQAGPYMIADSNEKFFRGCPSTVGFLNRDTGKYIHLISNPGMSGVTGTQYHIDPHPRFCHSDQYIVFTTTIRDEVDLVIAGADDLIERTS